MKSNEIIKRFKEIYFEYDKRAIKDKYMAYKIMAQLALNNTKKERLEVLDLGCGTGLSSLGFLKNKSQVTGVDISKEMLSLAKKYKFKELICQDLEKPLKVKKNYFDIVMLIGVMEFIENPLKLFGQIKAKLNKNGLFAVTIPKKSPANSNMPIKSYSKNEIERIIRKSKFKIVKRLHLFGYYKRTKLGKQHLNYYGYLLRNDP